MFLFYAETEPEGMYGGKALWNGNEKHYQRKEKEKGFSFRCLACYEICRYLSNPCTLMVCRYKCWPASHSLPSGQRWIIGSGLSPSFPSTLLSLSRSIPPRKAITQRVGQKCKWRLAIVRPRNLRLRRRDDL